MSNESVRTAKTVQEILDHLPGIKRKFGHANVRMCIAATGECRAAFIAPVCFWETSRPLLQAVLDSSTDGTVKISPFFEEVESEKAVMSLS